MSSNVIEYSDRNFSKMKRKVSSDMSEIYLLTKRFHVDVLTDGFTFIIAFVQTV